MARQRMNTSVTPKSPLEADMALVVRKVFEEIFELALARWQSGAVFSVYSTDVESWLRDMVALSREKSSLEKDDA